MNKDLSKEIIALLTNHTKQLNNALLKIEGECKEQEFVFYRRGFGRVMGYILTDILNPLFKEHPDLVPEPMQEQFINK